MNPHSETPPQPSAARRIISRFAHLLSAQVVEGLFSTAFILVLARSDDLAFGEVMYALAAGAIVTKVVQFGLYYPLVSELGEATEERAAAVVNRVNLIKLGLLIMAMLGVWGLAVYKALSPRMAWLLLLICFGCGLEALAETFFAHLRVRGRQKTEARVKMVASVSSYGFGLVAAVLKLNPVLLGCFKLISGLIRIVLGAAASIRSLYSSLIVGTDWLSLRRIFLASTVFGFIHILGILYNKTNIFFLESVAGVRGVAVYSAAWTPVDAIATLGSEQLLAWVVFPFLSTLWWQNRKAVAPLVRRAAQWLLAAALPTMFVLYVESDFIIGLLYKTGYPDAPGVMRSVVWTILLSFESNLMSYMMIVAGAQNVLLSFAVVTTLVNLILNVTLVESLGLPGACLVIVLTKLTMAGLVTIYCQGRFRLFKPMDFLFLVLLAAACLLVFVAGAALLPARLAGVMAVGLYIAAIWKIGPRYLGNIHRKEAPPVGGHAIGDSTG
jgi:O-antigen/teichoic acid export membrane protein